MAKRNFDPAVAETVIGNGLHVKGNLEASNDVWIDGVIDGNVSAEGNVTIGTNGRISGDVRAANITAAGQTKGNLEAKDRVVIEPSGHVRGNIKCSGLSVADGASINGAIVMPDQETDSNQNTNAKPS